MEHGIYVKQVVVWEKNKQHLFEFKIVNSDQLMLRPWILCSLLFYVHVSFSEKKGILKWTPISEHWLIACILGLYPISLIVNVHNAINLKVTWIKGRMQSFINLLKQVYEHMFQKLLIFWAQNNIRQYSDQYALEIGVELWSNKREYWVMVKRKRIPQ